MYDICHIYPKNNSSSAVYSPEGIKAKGAKRIALASLNGPRATATYESSLHGRPLGGTLQFTVYVLTEGGTVLENCWIDGLEITEGRLNYMVDLDLYEVR